MKRASILVLSVAMAIVGTGAASAAESDQAFIKKVIQGDLGEIEIGQLAQKNGGSDAAKSFGEMLANDHSANRDQAQSIASALGVTPPTAPDPQSQKTIDKLSKLSGKAFDRELAKDMIADHQKDIREFTAMQRDRNTPVADFAKQTLPTLRKHLQTAEDVRKQG